MALKQSELRICALLFAGDCEEPTGSRFVRRPMCLSMRRRGFSRQYGISPRAWLSGRDTDLTSSFSTIVRILYLRSFGVRCTVSDQQGAQTIDLFTLQSIIGHEAKHELHLQKSTATAAAEKYQRRSPAWECSLMSRK